MNFSLNKQPKTKFFKVFLFKRNLKKYLVKMLLYFQIFTQDNNEFKQR